MKSSLNQQANKAIDNWKLSKQIKVEGVRRLFHSNATNKINPTFTFRKKKKTGHL